MAYPLPSNIFDVSCPSRELLGQLADKWTVLVVVHLGYGPVRFSRLQRELGGVSTRTLTQTLRHLERSGFVARKVTPTVPVTVEYNLTKHGSKLCRIFDALRVLIENNLGIYLEAGRLYDAPEQIGRSKVTKGPRARGDRVEKKGK